jgi:hypothetical protein
MDDHRVIAVDAQHPDLEEFLAACVATATPSGWPSAPPPQPASAAAACAVP